MLANNVSPTANVSPCSREESSKRMEGAKLIDENNNLHQWYRKRKKRSPFEDTAPT